MEIAFEINGIPAMFSRSWFTGHATLDVAGNTLILQSGWDPSTHFSVCLTRTWTAKIQNYNVEIRKTRPLLAPGFRPHAYQVFVGGRLIAERIGY